MNWFRKGQVGLETITPIIITFVIVAITAVVGLQLLADEQADLLTGAAGCNSTDVSACAADYNATVDAIEGVAKFPSKLPLLASVFVLVIIIGVLYLIYRTNK